MSLETDERWTPQNVLDVVRAVGLIGLDPCAPPSNPCGARRWYTEADNGLEQPWRCSAGEVVYVNPPYSRGELARWTSKIVRSASADPDLEIIALTPCDLGTQWARELFTHTAAFCGWHGRIAFVKPDGTYDQGAKQPSLFWYFGERPRRFFRAFAAHANVVVMGGR